jgi:hypothetical protein
MVDSGPDSENINEELQMMGTTQNIAWVYHNTGLPIFLWHL